VITKLITYLLTLFGTVIFVSSLKYLVGESKTTLVQSIISFHSFHT